jgi:tubulin-folding cofactor B
MSVEELRRYVTAQDGKNRFGSDVVCLTISHSNLHQKWIEIRFSIYDTIRQVKNKLYRHGGTAPESQKLQLLDARGGLVCEMLNDDQTLGQYRCQNDYEIRIVDLDNMSLSKSGWLEDVSLVQKYVMPDDVYDAREGTVRKFKQMSKMEHSNVTSDEVVNENLTVGRRCEVGPGGRRGEIRFIGEAPLVGSGIWVGVALDEPLGKNDGIVKGQKLFSCPPNHGVLARQDKVEVGDFPVRSIFEESSDDEI